MVGDNTQGFWLFPGSQRNFEKKQRLSITRLKNYYQDIRRLARDSIDFTRDPSRNNRELGPSGSLKKGKSLSLPPYTQDEIGEIIPFVVPPVIVVLQYMKFFNWILSGTLVHTYIPFFHQQLTLPTYSGKCTLDSGSHGIRPRAVP